MLTDRQMDGRTDGLTDKLSGVYNNIGSFLTFPAGRTGYVPPVVAGTAQQVAHQ